jgi:hypothetical protein
MSETMIVSEVRPSAGNGETETPEKRTGIAAPDFLGSLFSPLDRVAVQTLERSTGRVEPRMVSAEVAASEPFQRWLRFKNANGWDIFVALNVFKPDAQRRTKDDLLEVRHAWVDLDSDGVANLSRLRASSLVPTPTFILATSPQKFQVIWRLSGATVAECEALNRALALEFGGDPQSCDAVHVMRLCGFANKKYSSLFWVTGDQHSDQTYRLSDFHLPLEVPQPKPEPRELLPGYTTFSRMACAPNPWDKRPEATIDEVLEAAGYKRDGRNFTCPTCGHAAVSVDRSKALFYCHGCGKGGHIGSLAHQMGRRLA